MDALERHRLFLYGRTGLSLALYVVAMVLSASAAVTQTTEWNAILVVAFLVGAVLLLPRRTAPTGEAEEAAGEEALEHFKRVRRWLTWTRFAYLAIAVAILLGLPRLL